MFLFINIPHGLNVVKMPFCQKQRQNLINPYSAQKMSGQSADITEVSLEAPYNLLGSLV